MAANEDCPLLLITKLLAVIDDDFAKIPKLLELYILELFMVS